MHNILITGHNGYLGSIVIKQLHADISTGKVGTLVGIDLRATPADKQLAGVHYYAMDIRSAEIAEVLKRHQITTVVHLAAVIDSNSMPRQTQYEIDVLGTENILKACIAAGVSHIIVTSSGAAYGYHPDNPAWLTEQQPLRGNEIFAYSHHKRLAEELLAQYRQSNPQLRQTIFRVGTILGANTRNLITNLFDKPKIIGIRGFVSPFVFVWDKDVTDCIVQAIYTQKAGIYNVAGDGALPNAEIAKILGKPYRNLPAALLRPALWIGKKLRLTQYGPEQLLFLQYRPVLDNRLLKTEFGYTPQKTSLETFLYFLEQQKKHINTRSANVLFP